MDNQRTTALGTPCSPKWEEEWIAEVERVEGELGRRICGAHSPAWTPCKLGSTHPNGRCRFHGGAPGIGAPHGNRNAVTHGLYARRIQQCGTHCPLWQHCPMAGRDVLAVPPAERPYCAYESLEYARTVALLRDPGGEDNNEGDGDDDEVTRDPGAEALAAFGSDDAQGGMSLVRHNIALFQTMLSRATAALRITRLTDETHAEGEHYTMHAERVSALVQAQLRIARELRQWIRLASADAVRALLGDRSGDDDTPTGGFPSMMAPILEKVPNFVEDVLAAGQRMQEECESEGESGPEYGTPSNPWGRDFLDARSGEAGPDAPAPGAA